MNKICSKCGVEKDVNEFYKNKNSKDGLRYACKMCCEEYKKKHEKTEEYKECQRIRGKKYRKENKEKIKEYQKIYRKENKEKFKDYHKEYNKEYYDKNLEKLRKTSKSNYKKNKNKINKRNLKYTVNRLKEDPFFRFTYSIRSRIRIGIKDNRIQTKKSNHTKELLCCSFDEARAHLEKQFRDNMSWENYGKYWHIDHIIPVSFFNLEDSTEQYLAFHYGNLQPLTKEENYYKHDTIPNENFKY